jgi:hypothetical protein
VLVSILSDAKFLYRTQTEPPALPAGRVYRISDLDMASQLSFFLWSSIPDEPLLDLAKRGELQGPVVLERETRRMLKDPRASALTVNFASQWLRLWNLRSVGHLPLYPDFDEALLRALQQETELFVGSILLEDRSIVDLLTADHTFVNERLARHYGIPSVFGEQFRRITLGPDHDVRRGLLGKAAALTVTSHPDRTSITTRGQWLLETLLGIEPPPPPPNVLPLPERIVDAPMRVVMDQHMAGAPDERSCRLCHRIMDPFGIALENFDRAGRWRTTANGQALDTATELVDGTVVRGPADLRNVLVGRSDQFTRAFTERLLIYALGRGVGYRDMPLVRSIAGNAARDNNRFSAIVLGIVQSEPFQWRARN